MTAEEAISEEGIKEIVAGLTIDGFRAWLSSFSDYAEVGLSRRCVACPISKCLLAMSGHKISVLGQLLNYKVMDSDSNDVDGALPDWAKLFISAVDDLPDICIRRWEAELILDHIVSEGHSVLNYQRES